MIDFDTYRKIAFECEKFGQINCCKNFKKLPKVQQIAQSGHTAHKSNQIGLMTQSFIVHFSFVFPETVF